MYKAIIFDFFDVIHEDPLRAWLDSIGLKREGRVDDIANALDLGQIGYHEYVEQLAAATAYDPVKLHAQFSAPRLNHEVKQLIVQLRSHCKVGLVSNAAGDELRPILTRHNLAELFHEIIISSEVRLAKPDPAIFHMMLQRLGLQPEQAIFTDDNPRNVAAAEAIGMRGLVFDHCAGLRQSLHQLGFSHEQLGPV